LLKRTLFMSLFAILGTSAFSATILQENFTPAQNGTLPATLSSTYDPGVDSIVVPLATMQPAVGVDHTGGDGYVCRVGDLQAGGGIFQYVFQAAGSPVADCRLTAWVYIDLTNNFDASPQARTYFLILRHQGNDPGAGSLRQGYMFAVARGATEFSGVTQIDRRPFLVKKVGTTHTQIGTTAVGTVADGWHLFAIETVGTTIKGFIDGIEVCQGTDNSYASGFPSLAYCERNGSASSYPYAAAYDDFLYESVIPAAAADWALFE
jgi:hypothetical protein